VEDDMAAIRVEDDGAGIDPEVLPRIFELFTREQRASAPEGLGVGLSVVKNLVELHGGFVEGRSPGQGKGSVFTVRLPVVPPGADEASDA
jgi:two-component system CheB/CheR fusion protein